MVYCYALRGEPMKCSKVATFHPFNTLSKILNYHKVLSILIHSFVGSTDSLSYFLKYSEL